MFRIAKSAVAFAIYTVVIANVWCAFAIAIFRLITWTAFTNTNIAVIFVIANPRCASAF